MVKVYISPSTQDHNVGVGSYGTEEAEMNKIADVYCAGLQRHGIEFKRNSPSMELTQVADDSNAYHPDIHLAIHSNAGGGQGTEVWAYAAGTNSEKLANCLYKYVAALTPSPDRGVKFNNRLLEISDKVHATSAIVETAFHDNPADASFIQSHHMEIGEALVHGTCDYVGIAYKPLGQPEVTPPSPQTAPAPTPAPVADTEKEQLKARLADVTAKLTAAQAQAVSLQKQAADLQNQVTVASNRATSAKNALKDVGDWKALTRRVLGL